MEQVAVSLLLWLAAHSSYEVGGLAPPPIVLLTPAALSALVREGAAEAAPAEPLPAIHVHGLYRPRDGPAGTVYLVRPEDTPGAERYAQPSDNPWFRERLLHELVHFVQHASGETSSYRCPSQGEYRAYQLGARYLHQIGAADPLPNRRMLAFMATGC